MKYSFESKIIRWLNEASNSQYLNNIRDTARRNRSFYKGDHWDSGESSYYKAKGIEPISVDRVKPIIKTALGIYLQNKQDIRLLSNNKADGYAVGVANKVLKNAEQMSNSQKKYERLFQYGSVDGVSYLKYETNKHLTKNGSPELKVLTSMELDYDPTCKDYDINNGRYVIEKEWVYIDEANILYPNAKFSSGNNNLNSEESMVSFHTGEGSNYNPGETDDSEDGIDLTLRDSNKILLKHMWWKELIDGYIVSDENVSRYTKDKELAENLKKAGYTIEKSIEYKLHKTTIYNQQIIKDEKDPVGEGVTEFPFFRFSPLFYDGTNIGMIDNVISLNKEENMYRTLCQKHMMMTVNGGFIVRGGTETAKAELSNNAGKDNIVIDKSKLGGEVDIINPPSFPTAYQMLANDFGSLTKEVSGISDSIMGSDQTEQSGRAIYLRTQQNKIQFQEILENLFTTIQYYGKFLFKYVITEDIYTDDEIMNIVDESDLLSPELMQKATEMVLRHTGGIGLPEPNIPAPPSPEVMTMIRPEDKPKVLQEVQTGIQAARDYAEQYPRLQKNFQETVKYYAKKWLLEQYRSEDFKNYSVDVVTSPHAPTEAMAVFAQLTDINNSVGGGAIPLEVLTDLSIIPERYKTYIKSKIMQVQNAEMTNNTGSIINQMQATGQI